MASRSLLEGNECFQVPEVIDELSARRVLAMELVQGVPLDCCVDLDQETRNQVGLDSTNNYSSETYDMEKAAPVKAVTAHWTAFPRRGFSGASSRFTVSPVFWTWKWSVDGHIHITTALLHPFELYIHQIWKIYLFFNSMLNPMKMPVQIPEVCELKQLSQLAVTHSEGRYSI